MILLMGGTGLLGGQVLKRLREERYPVRLFTRGSRDWKDSSAHDVRRKGGEIVIGDAFDLDCIEEAVDGCTAIINLVGCFPPPPGTDFDELHVSVAENIVDVAKRCNIQRIIHVSCLGAEKMAESEYFDTKYDAEETIRQSSCYWTIFRPSYLFTEKFPFLDMIMPLIKFPLVMPIIGSGQNSIQPVHADDVAQCIVSSVFDKATVEGTYELAGADQYAIQALMEKARKALKIGGLSMNIPSPTAAKAANGLAKMLPKNTMSIETLQLLLSNSDTDNNALENYFKIQPKPLDAYFSRILSTY